MHFPESKCMNCDWNFTEVSRDPINNIPALVRIMAWHRPGAKPLSKPMMVELSMHIWATRPQWVKPSHCNRFEDQAAVNFIYKCTFSSNRLQLLDFMTGFWDSGPDNGFRVICPIVIVFQCQQKYYLNSINSKFSQIQMFEFSKILLNLLFDAAAILVMERWVSKIMTYDSFRLLHLLWNVGW